MGRDDVSRASSPPAIAEYLQMVAMVSGEGVSDDEVEKVGVRIDGWIASLPQNLKLQVSRRFFAPAFSAFASARTTRIFDHFFFSWLHNPWQLAWGWKISCVWVVGADKVPDYSRDRFVLRSSRSSEVEKCSKT